MSRAAYVVAFVCLAAFLALALGDLLTTSPTSDETVHLAAGWSYLATHDFRINPEHPPLLKVMAAAPLMSMQVSRDALQSEGWRDSIAHLTGEWSFPHSFFYEQKNGVYVNDPATMFRRARIVLLLFCGLGTALVVFFWALELWGPWGAALSLALYCFSPNFIAHSGLVTTDAGVCFLMTAAVYFFWRWWRTPSILNASLFVLAFAVAQIVKFSALFLFLLIPILALFAWRGPAKSRPLHLFALYGGGIVAAWVVIWGAYGFRFAASESPLPMKQAVDEWYAKLHFIGGGETLTDESLRRAAETTPIGWFGRVLEIEYYHHLLPEAYVYGIAQMQSYGALRQSYLNGEQSLTGFRSYFLEAFLFKTPIATIAAIACALFVAFRSRRREPFLLIPAALYLLFALTSHVDLGIRHLLPIYPFLYVLCGILGRRFLIAAAAAALSCLVVFAPFDPMWGHHLSYFNELAGGPTRGWKILSDSNVDWGQDLPRLHDWLAAHGGAGQKINLVYFGTADPHYYGIVYADLLQNEPPVHPGYLAISVTRYSGAASDFFKTHEWQEFVASHDAKLVGRAGYSILIFEMP
jgi:hypothetical protein